MATEQKRTVAEVIADNQSEVLEDWLRHILALPGNRTLELISEEALRKEATGLLQTLTTAFSGEEYQDVTAPQFAPSIEMLNDRQRHGCRDDRRSQRPHFRTVLHDQRGRRGHRSGADHKERFTINCYLHVCQFLVMIRVPPPTVNVIMNASINHCTTSGIGGNRQARRPISIGLVRFL